MCGNNNNNNNNKIQKRNKINVTPEKDDMTSADQTPGGYKFAPLVAINSQQGRANQHEQAWFGLFSPWFSSSRSGIPLHGVGQPWLSLQRSICLMKRSAPCSAVLCHSLVVLGCSRPLVGVDAESSEVVQETSHPLFFLAPHTDRAPHHFSEHHALRQSRIFCARHKSREQDPPPA